MKKIVIFNVGGALSSYAEIDNKIIIIDLGASTDFSPVDHFLIPISRHAKFSSGLNNKFIIDQLFLSHLDKDHITDYDKFKDVFHPNYMTCPNDNGTQDSEFKVNRELLGEKSDLRDSILDEMKTERSTTKQNEYNMSFSNPLVSVTNGIFLFYIKPQFCEQEEKLKSGYANNISLVLYIFVGNKTLLFPGDILKEGLKYLIDNNERFKKLLTNKGIDYLVTPHHGLQTSFSEYLFETINGNKTSLNIISEKIRVEESNENRSNIDTRYYSSDYSTGDNSLSQNAVKTSMGHIVISFETDETEITQYSDIKDVIDEFTS